MGFSPLMAFSLQLFAYVGADAAVDPNTSLVGCGVGVGEGVLQVPSNARAQHGSAGDPGEASTARQGWTHEG